ncbi:hypothetical protein ABG067_000667 [Albugo candida]
MRLVTHNMLICNKKGVTNGFPLRIEAEDIDVIESEFRPEFLQKLLGKLDYSAFLQAATSLKLAEKLPSCLTEDVYEDDQAMKNIHHVMFDVHIQKGRLICPESNREFPIVDGIPNMLLNDDEV